jgi:toxin CptA
MSSSHDQPANSVGEYPLGPSLLLAGILTFGHCAVAASLWITPLAFEWKCAAVALIAVSLCLETRAAMRWGSGALIALRISRDGLLSVQSRRGEWLDCEVLGSTCVTALLTVVNLRAKGARRIRNVVILTDTMDAENFRRLRVWLRWRPSATPD